MARTNFLISVDTNGSAPVSGFSGGPIISADGRYVAFSSTAASLVGGDSNGSQDIFLRDRVAGSTTLVSVSTNGVNPASQASMLLSMSADGRFILFSSYAGNLAINAPGGIEQLFHRDTQLGTTKLISTNGIAGVANGPAVCMSRDGRFVAFTTSAFSPPASGMRLWDSQTGITTLIESDFPVPYAFSPDNRWLAYASTFLNGVFLYDVGAKTNRRVSTEAFNPSAFYRPRAQFSGNGQLLVYSTWGVNAPGDTNGAADIYIYDVLAATNQFVSTGFNLPYSASGFSDLPGISADGRFVVYRSRAKNIVPGVTNGAPQTYLYDRQTGTTTLVGGSSPGGGIANCRAQAPVFSGDSQTLVFRTWAPDMLPFDFNQRADVFSWRLASTNPIPVFVAQIVYAPTSGKSPTLTWTLIPGKTYQVQYKDNLTDPIWQPLTGTVWIDEDHGYATDLAPNPVQRFYRVRAY